jgi:hypothetical protein
LRFSRDPFFSLRYHCITGIKKVGIDLPR